MPTHCRVPSLKVREVFLQAVIHHTFIVVSIEPAVRIQRFLGKRFLLFKLPSPSDYMIYMNHLSSDFSNLISNRNLFFPLLL